MEGEKNIEKLGWRGPHSVEVVHATVIMQVSTVNRVQV